MWNFFSPPHKCLMWHHHWQYQSTTWKRRKKINCLRREIFSFLFGLLIWKLLCFRMKIFNNYWAGCIANNFQNIHVKNTYLFRTKISTDVVFDITSNKHQNVFNYILFERVKATRFSWTLKPFVFVASRQQSYWTEHMPPIFHVDISFEHLCHSMRRAFIDFF